jgi:hypothetical protein
MKDFRLWLQLARNYVSFGFSLLKLGRTSRALFLKWASKRFQRVAGSSNLFCIFARG